MISFLFLCETIECHTHPRWHLQGLRTDRLFCPRSLRLHYVALAALFQPTSFAIWTRGWTTEKMAPHFLFSAPRAAGLKFQMQRFEMLLLRVLTDDRWSPLQSSRWIRCVGSLLDAISGMVDARGTGFRVGGWPSTYNRVNKRTLTERDDSRRNWILSNAGL